MSELVLEKVTAKMVENKAIELLAECLKMQASEIDSNQKLTGYGLDSINAMTMVGDLEDHFEIELPSTLLWDYETIDKISNYIADNFEELADE